MIYDCYNTDQGGMLVSTFNNVMETQRVTGLQVAEGDDVAIVLSTENLWPGMRVVAKGIPANTLVLSIDSETTFTMTSAATATGTGLILIAHAYVDAEVVKQIHIEHYRDIFGGSTSFQITSGGLDSPSTSGGMNGAGVYIIDPVKVSVLSGGGTAGQMTGTLTAAVNDLLAHVPPRTQTRDVTQHFLICKDGTILGVHVFPGMHLAQRVS